MSCFAACLLDSLILLLIVPAGQLTKMAALPPGSLQPHSGNKRERGGGGAEENNGGEIKYFSRPSPREVPDLYFTPFFPPFLSQCPQSDWKAHGNLFLSTFDGA